MESSLTTDFVYLCGPINGCTDEECKDWREWAKAHLKFPTLDPMRRDYRGREMECVDEIVAKDIEDIYASRFILVNHPQPSTGTDMEMRIGYAEAKKTVVTVIPRIKPPSPWLVAHSTRTMYSIPEAVEFINRFAR